MVKVTHKGYLRSTQVAFVALYTIIITGSLVRLTGSGLGCADWPKCSDAKFIDVSSTHAAIEQINRLFTGVVAATVIVCVLLAFKLRPKRRDLVGMSIMLVVGVLAQVMIGAIVVWTGLNPISNIAHFLVSIFLMSVAYMLVQHARIIRLTENAAPRGEPRLKDKFAISLVRLMVVATGLAVLTGTVVTGSGPHAGDEDAIRLGFGVTRVVRIHNATVWLAMFASLVLAVLIRRRRNLTEILQRSVSRFLFVLVVQGGIGYTQYFLGVPVILVALHVAISVAVWLCAVDVYWNSRLSTQQPNVID